MEVTQDLLDGYVSCQVRIVVNDPRQEWIGEVESVQRLRRDEHDNSYAIRFAWKVKRGMPNTAWQGCLDTTFTLVVSDYASATRMQGDLILNAGKGGQRLHFYSRGEEIINPQLAQGLAARPTSA